MELAINQWGAVKMGLAVAAAGSLGVLGSSQKSASIQHASIAQNFMISEAASSLSDETSSSEYDRKVALGGGTMRGAGALSGAGGGFESLKKSRAASGPSAQAGREETVRKIVRTASLVFEVDDQGKARALVRAAAFRHGGEIDSDQSTGEGENQSGVIVIKAAPEQLDAILKELDGVGRAVSRSVSSQNMSEEYVDLKARLENYRKVEKRLTDLLAFKTHKLGDVLQVEHELERVGQEIEQTLGRMKYIDHLAAQSCVTVRLQQPHRVETAQAPGLFAEIRNSLAHTLNTFVGTGLALLNLTGFVLAIGLWTLPVTALVWLLKRRIWG